MVKNSHPQYYNQMGQIKLYTQLVIHLNKYLKGEKRLNLNFTELMSDDIFHSISQLPSPAS